MVVNYDKKTQQWDGIFNKLFSKTPVFDENTANFINTIKQSGIGKTADEVEELAKSMNVLNQDVVDVSKNMVGANFNAKEYEKALVQTGKAASGLSSTFKALGGILGSMLITAAIEVLIQTIYACATASDRLYEKASKLGQEFKSVESDIDSYKTQIQDLRDKINDSSTSIEESRQAREDLLRIQDELISKYGDEKASVFDITEAINGEVDALDRLKDAQWAQTLANFEQSDGIFDSIGDWFNRVSHFGIANEGSNLAAMMSDMDRAYKIMNVNAGDAELASEFTKAYDSLKSLQDGFIEIDGNIYDAYEDLNSFYSAMKNGGASATSLRYIADEMNRLKKQIDSAGELYNEVVLRDRILDGGDIESTYNKYMQSLSEYKEAYKNGNEELVSKQIDDLYQIRQELEQSLTNKVAADEITPEVKDSIIHTFGEIYPELQSVFDKMDFKINTPTLKQLDSSLTADDILKDLSEEGITTNESLFNDILEQAEEAGIVYGKDAEKVQQLLNLLVEWGIIQAGITSKVEETNETISDWDLESELSKFNINADDFGKFLEGYKELNKELELTDEEYERAAVAQYAFDQGVEDLRSHLNDYLENLDPALEGTSNYVSSLQSLANDLSAILEVDYSVADAEKFAKDAANIDLLRQALDGDNDALNRLRANAAQPIITNLVANTELDTETFWADYNTFVQWLIDNPDLGELNAHAYLDDQPFIQGLINAIKQGQLAADEVKKIFNTLHLKADWNTERVPLKIPTIYEDKRGFPHTGTKGTTAYNVVYAEIPSNIHYVNSGGNGSGRRPTATKPTSSSGSNYKPEQKSGGGGGGGGSKDPTEEAKKDEEELEDTYDEFFDYFERRVKVISDAISLLDANLENVVGSKAKNTLLDAQMHIYKMQQQEYADAQNMYQEMADRALAKIEDSKIVEKIKNGAVGIDEFIGKGNEEVVNAINDYTQWADKVADCKQQLAELKEQIRQLELSKMQNILQDWQDVFDLRQNNAIDLIDKQIDLITESGNLVGRAFYEAQRSQTEGQLAAMQQAKRELAEEMNRGLANGSIQVGTDEWLEEVGLLQQVEGQILDCQRAIEEYNNAILNIHTEVFERIIDQFDDLNDEMSDLDSFLSEDKVGDKFGNWSDAGIARAGLLAQQYELARYKVQKYNEEINLLNAQYGEGKYSTIEYTEKLAELMDALRESAKDAESAKDSMIDLNEARIDIVVEGINEEIEAYEKLINAEKDALSAEKDLHSYRKQIADANKSIVAIQKQLAAIENDNSASANAKRKKLQQQLADAQDSLAEQEYDHSIETQKQALDEQLEQFRDARQQEIDDLHTYLEETERVIADTFEKVRANAESIGQTITATAQEHGIQVSSALTEAWKAGENAIAEYGAVLTPATSEFISQVANVEAQTWELQNQADLTADSLAAMFATRADNLVNELTRSWEAEANAKVMADALRDSMVYALESGYDISSVLSSLNAVANAAEKVADAANDAASALDNAISRQNAFNNMPKSGGGYTYEGAGTSIGNNVVRVYNNSGSLVAITSKDNAKKKYGATGINGYFKGLTKAQQNELAWTQELGDELIVSPTRNSVLTPIKSGDAVIDAKATRNLFELAKIDPQDLLNGAGANVVAPQVESTNNSVSIGTLVNVEGSISSENLDAVKATIQSELKKTFRNINSGLRR